MLETKLEALTEIEKKITQEETLRNNFIKDKNESSTESNLGE